MAFSTRSEAILAWISMVSPGRIFFRNRIIDPQEQGDLPRRSAPPPPAPPGGRDWAGPTPGGVF